MEPKYAVVFIWIVWAASWLAAALWAKVPVKSASRGSELPYRLAQGFGLFAVFSSLGRGDFDTLTGSFRAQLLSTLFAQLWVLPDVLGWVMALAAAAGFAFAWWARIHLGDLWSSSVTRKEGHTVIDTGPYAIVRHPIYTGMLLGTIALVCVSGRLLAVIGLVLVAIGIVMKARLEERFLSAELGADAYAAYAKRVPMLVPGLPV